jgi:hypothetical protein
MLKIRNKLLNCAITGMLVSLCGWILPATAAEPDRRSASLACALDKSGRQVDCDYRHSASLVVKDVSLKVADVAVQIPAKGLAAYPTGQQTTALLFLVDVSDPGRKNTVEKKNVNALAEMLANLKPHQKVGIAVFDSDMRLLAPISSDPAAAKSAASALKAGGQSTEYYRSILSAITLLQKTEASRKALIIMSDGKAEDTAYKHEDVVKAAQEADVVILGLGYLERLKDSPYLQKIKRLADETQGLYLDATEGELPPTFVLKPFSFVEKGGRVSFDVGKNRGKQSVAIILRSSDGKPLELKTEIDFPDTRTGQEQAFDFFKEYWPALLAGLVALIGIVVVGVRIRRKRALAAKPQIAYASLVEMNGSGTQYPLTKTAVCIGRSTDNDISLANDSISSHHAEIHRRRAGDVYVVDLGSSNGVYVNEAKVAQAELHEGDVIELGEVRLRFTAN